MPKALSYYIESQNYLDSLAEYVSQLLDAESKHNLILVLPNYLSIELLTIRLINKRISLSEGACFIPQIITYEEYLNIIKSDYSFFSTKHYQQVLIMTSIVRNHFADRYSAVDSILVAKEIIKIYLDLKKNNINYSDIIGWVDEDLAEHWWVTAGFLKFCFETYDQIFDKILRAPQNVEKDCIFIFSGLIDTSFLNYIEDARNKIIILPPVGGDFSNESQYKKKASYKFLENKYFNFFYSAQNLSVKKLENQEIKKQYYIEFNNLLEEADYLFHRIRNKKTSIAIILNNPLLEKILSSKLNLCNIRYNSSFGEPYNNFPEAELFINLAKFKSENGSFISFISLLRSRFFLNNSAVEEFIEKILGKNRFFENFDTIYKIFSSDASEHIEFILNILKGWLECDFNQFNFLFLKLFEVFVSLYNYSDFYASRSDSEKFKNFMQDIQKLNFQSYKIKKEELGKFIYHILALKYTKSFDREAEVYLLQPEDAVLIDTEEVFFADFNHESYLANNMEDIWLSKKILKKLNIYNEMQDFEKLHYLVVLKTSMQECYFTRSKYKEGILLEKCQILSLIANMHYISVVVEDFEDAKKGLENVDVNLGIFPKILYPTNIEQLIRDPYGFFARKVLNIRKTTDLYGTPESKDYGQIVHEIIEVISTQKNFVMSDIIESVMAKRGLPSYILNLWKNPLLSIGKEIEKLNLDIIESGGLIFSEIEGEMDIKLINTNITLKAIADRIEVLPDKIRIIDFKTGQVPSKKDLLQGKCPQLILEAIILMNNGFKIDSVVKGKILELVYIKVSSKRPFLEETVLTINEEELILHFHALVNFLSYYYSQTEISLTNEYLPEFWRPNYDDYEHFRRKIL